MIKRLVFLFFILSFDCVYAQTDSIAILDDNPLCNPFDFTIIIDGKLPSEVTVIMKNDNNFFGDSIVRTIYYRKNLPQNNIPIQMCESFSDSTLIYVEYRFREPIGPWSYKTHSYRDTLPWKIFKMIELVCINEIKKKPNIYYIYYKLQSPYYMDILYKKEYGNKYRFAKRIFKGLYPHSYTIPERRGGKTYPIY